MKKEKERQSQSRSIALIENHRARRVTYKKRSNCVKKKTSELATLCGVDAFAVIFGPDGEVDTWPENRSDAIAVLKAYQTKKTEYPSKKQEKAENDEDWVRGLSTQSLTELLEELDSKIGAVYERMKMLSVGGEEQNRATEAITTQSLPYYFDHDHGADRMFDAQMALTTPTWQLDCFVDHYMIDAQMGLKAPTWPLDCFVDHRPIDAQSGLTAPTWALDCFVDHRPIDAQSGFTAPTWALDCFVDHRPIDAQSGLTAPTWALDCCDSGNGVTGSGLSNHHMFYADQMCLTTPAWPLSYEYVNGESNFMGSYGHGQQLVPNAEMYQPAISHYRFPYEGSGFNHGHRVVQAPPFAARAVNYF